MSERTASFLPTRPSSRNQPQRQQAKRTAENPGKGDFIDAFVSLKLNTA